MAILGFNKPGIRNIILSTNNNKEQGQEELSTEDMISLLARYMHLDDVVWVRNRIKTVGKDTVSLINDRDVDQSGQERHYQYLRDDLMGLRLARILSVKRQCSQDVSYSKKEDVINSSRRLQHVDKDNKNINKKKDENKKNKKEVFGLDTISEASREEDILTSVAPVSSLVEEISVEALDMMSETSVLSAYDEALEKMKRTANITTSELQEYLDMTGQYDDVIMIYILVLINSFMIMLFRNG